MKLRIHGDNIIECERALKLISLAYKGTVIAKRKNIFMPSYSIQNGAKKFLKLSYLADTTGGM